MQAALASGWVAGGSSRFWRRCRGCASQPSEQRGARGVKGGRESASQLYAGAPTIVHSTEYPITSAADGIERGDEAYREGKLDLAVYLVRAIAVV